MSRASVVRSGLSRLAAYVSGQLLVKALYLGGIVVATRAAGPDMWGVLSGGLALGIIGITLVNLGLSPHVSRELAAGRIPAAAVISAAVRFRLLATLVFIAVVPPILWLSIPSIGLAVASALTLYLVVDSWAQFHYAIMRGHEVTRYEVYGTICEKLLFFVAALLAVAAPAVHRLTMLAAGFLIAAVLNLTIAAIGTARVRGAPALPWRRVLTSIANRALLRREFRYVRESAPFLFAALFTTIYFRIDAFMVATMVGPREAGWYSAAYRIIEGLMFVPQSMLVVFAPALVRTLQRDASHSPATVRQLAALQGAIVVPIALLLALEADWLTQTLYGDGYAPTSFLLLLLSPVLIAIGANFLLGGLLTAAYRQKRLLAITAAGALLNVALNALLLPPFGERGAVVATLVTEVFVAMAMLRDVSTALGGLSYLAPFARSAVICATAVLLSGALLRALDVPTSIRLGLELFAAIVSVSVLLRGLSKRAALPAARIAHDSATLADHPGVMADRR